MVAKAWVATLRRFSVHPLSNQPPVCQAHLRSPGVFRVRSSLLAQCNPASGGARPAPQKKKEETNSQALLAIQEKMSSEARPTDQETSGKKTKATNLLLARIEKLRSRRFPRYPLAREVRQLRFCQP